MIEWVIIISLVLLSAYQLWFAKRLFKIIKGLKDKELYIIPSSKGKMQVLDYNKDGVFNLQSLQQEPGTIYQCRLGYNDLLPIGSFSAEN